VLVEFLRHEARGQGSHALAAVLLGHVQGPEPQLAGALLQLRALLVGEVALEQELLLQRHEFALAELLDGGNELLELVGDAEVHFRASSFCVGWWAGPQLR
jgi:hypothetical protein